MTLRESFLAFPRQNSPLCKPRNIREIDAHKQRVTQTNMVYLIGLPHNIAHQEILGGYEYGGQYGEIQKILIKKNYFNDYASYSAYITYSSDEAASIAILAINNLLLGKSRIYASYGTNKYCSGFIKFGKCRKAECPFFHKIEPQKEIRQEDNKKLFQDQQLLAKSYILRHYQHMCITHEVSHGFPSRYQVLQTLIADGSIPERNISEDHVKQNSPKPKKQHKLSEEFQFQERSNALKEKKEKTSTRSDISTECSPTKTAQMEEDCLWDVEIIPRILKKLQKPSKSILGFSKEEAASTEAVTSLLLSLLP